MDKIEKALQKLTPKERRWVKQALDGLKSGSIESLDIKKLKERADIFRVRKGNIRIIYRITKNKKIYVIKIQRRNKDTYKL